MAKKKRLIILNSLKTDLFYTNSRIRHISDYLDESNKNFVYNVIEVAETIAQLSYIEHTAKKENVYYEIKEIIDEQTSLARETLKVLADFKMDIKEDLTEKE